MKRIFTASVLAIVLAFMFAGQSVAGWGGESSRQIRKTSGTDSLSVATRDTSAVWVIRDAKCLSMFVQYDGDSSKVSVQHSLDNTHWTTLVSNVQLDGTPGTTGILYAKQLVLAQSAGSAYYGGFIGYYLRAICYNDDKANKITNLSYQLQYEK